MEQNRFASVPRSEGRQIDEGLRTYFNKIYKHMSLGLLFTGIIALVTASSPELFAALRHPQTMAPTLLGWVVFLAPLGIIFFGLSPQKIQRMSVGSVAGMYYLLTGLIGLSMAAIFVIYTGESIARVFFITAGMFAAMSIFGYTTKKDLSGMGSLMFMGLIGIVIAMVVNIFLQSSMMQFVISGIGVVVFTGLIAWDTQRLKEIYHYSHGRAALEKMAVMGSLSLYLDFINLFQFLLYFLGNRE